MSARNQPSRLVWPPSPGYYRLRLVRGGWEVPARLSFDDGLWTAEIDGVVIAPPHADPVLAGADQIWHYGRPITELEYRLLHKLKQIVRCTDPSHPAVNPHRPIDPNRLRPLHPPERADG